MAKRPTKTLSKTFDSDSSEDASEVNDSEVAVVEEKPSRTTKSETIQISKQEYEDLRSRINTTHALLREQSGRMLSGAELEAKTQKLVQSFKNQRHIGKYRYMLWDSAVTDENGKTHEFSCDIPYSENISKVAAAWNTAMKRSIVEGKDTIKFKPLPPE